MAPPEYQHITFLGFKNLVANLLGDTGKVFWTDDELGGYTKEALRTWGLAAAYWRERGTFPTVSGTAWYDIRTQLPLLLASNITDRDIIKSVQYSTLEPATSQTSWTGTDMWTLAEVAQSIQTTRNRFIVETGQIINTSTVAMPSPNVYRVSLADDIIDLRRVVWFGTDNVYSTLFRVDEWSLVALVPNWPNTPGVPFAHSIMTTKPLQLLVAPPPLNSGTLRIITTNSIGELTPQTVATVLQVLDNSYGAIKWGTLANLLSGDGQGTDTTRYGIAMQRYAEAVELAKISPTILYAEINGVPVQPVPVMSLDTLVPGWETTSAAPTNVGLIGQNLLGVQYVPNGVYSITLDVVRSAPIPTANDDYIQVGREEIDTIAGYAAYLAYFKIGGQELVDAEKYLRDFYQAAATYNSRLKASALFTDSFFKLAASETSRPLRQMPQPPQRRQQQPK